MPSWTVNSRQAVGNQPPEDPFFVYLGHLRPDFLHRVGLYSPSEIETSFSFVFVRNPYARAVSLYNHFARYGFEEGFSAFVNHLDRVRSGASTRFEKRLRSMSKPMTHWTQPPKWPGWSKVFRVEDFPAAVVEIKETLRVDSEPIDIDVFPETVSKALIGAAEAKRISALFQVDFETFGYSETVPDRYQAG